METTIVLPLFVILVASFYPVKAEVKNMTTKVVKKEAKTPQTQLADPTNEICKVWSYVRFFYSQNKQLWQAVQQLQDDVNTLRNKKSGGD